MKPHNVSCTHSVLLPSPEIKFLEQRVCEKDQISLYQLMQRAGQAVFDTARERFPDAQNWLVLIGSGNNAGDGLEIARLAHEAGLNVDVRSVKQNAQFKAEAAEAFALFSEAGLTLSQFDEQALTHKDLVIDALLGTGLQGPLIENYLELIRSLNSAKVLQDYKVVSVDVPSGLNADTGAAHGAAVEADLTISLMADKPGLHTGVARVTVGELAIKPLSENMPDVNSKVILDDADALIRSIPRRSAVSHKGHSGRCLLIGGGEGYSGAIILAAEAAMRTGVGLLTVITCEATREPLLSRLPEAMVRTVNDPETANLTRLIEQADAILIGPGLGQEAWAESLWRMVLESNKPLIVDADALNLLARNKTMRDDWLLTPHPGEAGRLIGLSISEIEQDRFSVVKQLMQQYGGSVILKGAGSLAGYHRDLISVSDRGNAGMATAGMGDVLSGILVALAVRGLSLEQVARIGLALHGTAGDNAAESGEQGMLASDLINQIRPLVNH